MEVEIVAIEIKLLVENEVNEKRDRGEYGEYIEVAVEGKWKGWLVVEEIEGVLGGEGGVEGEFIDWDKINDIKIIIINEIQ